MPPGSKIEFGVSTINKKMFPANTQIVGPSNAFIMSEGSKLGVSVVSVYAAQGIDATVAIFSEDIIEKAYFHARDNISLYGDRYSGGLYYSSLRTQVDIITNRRYQPVAFLAGVMDPFEWHR